MQINSVNFDTFLPIESAIKQGLTSSLSQEFIKLKTSFTVNQITAGVLRWQKILPHTASLMPRLLQVDLIDSARCGLTCENKIGIALFIHGVILNAKRVSNEYFKKTGSHPLPLCRSLQYTIAEKATYVLIKTHQNSILWEMGGQKKVTAAIQIPNDTSFNPLIVAYSVNKTSNLKGCSLQFLLSELKIINEEYKTLLTEIAIHKKFSGNKGIWPLLGSAEYKTIRSFHSIPKASLITSLGFPAQEIYEGKITLSTAQHIELADQIICGVHLLHEAKHLHGDLKPLNVIFSILPKLNVMAGLIDFGASCQVNGVDEVSYPIEEGYYGTITCTAPELFGNKNFKGCLFKVEIWALGFLLYALFWKQNPPWAQTLKYQSDRYELEAEVASHVKNKMIGEAKHFIDAYRSILLKKQTLSVEEEYQLLIYDMMSFSPKDRPDSLMAVQRIAKLQEKTCQMKA